MEGKEAKKTLVEMVAFACDAGLAILMHRAHPAEVAVARTVLQLQVAGKDQGPVVDG